jgi:hypothetical protein
MQVGGGGSARKYRFQTIASGTISNFDISAARDTLAISPRLMDKLCNLKLGFGLYFVHMFEFRG